MKYAWAVVLLLMACSGQDATPPADVLPRARFKSILLEAQLIEARMNHELVIAHFTSIPGDQYYGEMFKAQGTTKEQFQRSFAYWSGRPDDMKAIYEEIVAELSRRRDEQPQ